MGAWFHDEDQYTLPGYDMLPRDVREIDFSGTPLPNPTLCPFFKLIIVNAF
jgi:hypothetical protein